MRWLIVLLISALAFSDITGMQMSLAPGLSVKNAILYLLAVALVARMILSNEHRLDMPAVVIAFAVLIGYAILTWLAAGFVIRYPRYDVIASGINLKSALVDRALFFFAAFYALRTAADVRTALRAFAIAFTAANFCTLTDIAGLTNFGVRIGTSGAGLGRVFGVFGNANETAGLIVCMLPLVVALAMASRGATRFAWWIAAMISLSVLIMTVSRGPWVAAVVGTLWATYVCRRAVPAGTLIRGGTIAAAAIVALVVLLVILRPEVGITIKDRILGQSTALDMEVVSSGRTAIWSTALERMMDSPLSLITGFGWDVYPTMPFRFAPHNHYLGTWFELGLPGLAAFLFLLGYVIAVARRTLDAPPNPLRPYMVGFLFGILPFTIAVFFGDLTNPWPYVWIYVGIVMRAAVLTLGPQLRAAPARRAPGRPEVRTHRIEPVATRRPPVFRPHQ